MRTKGRIQDMAVALLCVFTLSSCSGLQEQENENEERIASIEAQEMDTEESAFKEFVPETSVEGDTAIDASATETLAEQPIEKNGILEIYDAGDKITIPENIMVAQVSPEAVLTGQPVLYDQFRIDGWVFEWLISDYYDDDNWFAEDGVLVASREGSVGDAQIIHVQAEGGYATWVSAENKFEYVDVNFDELPDLLICTGHHGNQGLLTYYCFFQTEDGFVEAPTFTDIPNPAIDVENQLILSQWRNSATSHSWAEYQCRDNTFILYRELREGMVLDSDEEIWIWTVNGEEIARSDKLSMEEIADLLYNENSEWRIADDRWRTLYNNGLIADYSIYAEP